MRGNFILAQPPPKSCGVWSACSTTSIRKVSSLDDHPYKGNEILKERGYSDEIRRAIMSHAEYSGVTRDSGWKKLSLPANELAGFITACALVKSGKSLAEVDAKSVRRKNEDKAFARA